LEMSNNKPCHRPVVRIWDGRNVAGDSPNQEVDH
jgi:hypothetical protein